MDRRILSKGGISILEVTLALFIIGSIFSMVIPNYIDRINRAKYERTVNELMTIVKASIDYFNSQGSCPTGISQLAPEFITFVVMSSPFGTNYQINCASGMVTASVSIPTGISQKNPLGPLQVVINQDGQDLVEITQQLPNDFYGRLEYEKKHRYLQ